MRTVNIFNLIIMTAAAFFTLNAIAVPVTTVHVLENLSPGEQKEAMTLLQKRGFVASKKPLFEETTQALIITKTIATESDEPSVQIELVEKKGINDLPKTTYLVKFPTSEIKEAIGAFPHSAQLTTVKTMPVAFQK